MRARTYGPIDSNTTTFEPLPEDHPDYFDMGPTISKKARTLIGAQHPARIRYPKFNGADWYFHTGILEDKKRRQLLREERRERHETARAMRKQGTSRRLTHSQACAVATPSWVTRSDRRHMTQMKKHAHALTIKTGIPHNRDHIIPLRGDFVCGLHIPENLRVVPAKLNAIKSNHFEVK